METTLNIRVDILERVAKAAQLKNMTCSEMIVLLIKQVMGDIRFPEPIGRLVRYQERRWPKDWRVFHVQVREDDYEYLVDCRRLFKMSVSLILAYAVQRYLSKLLKRKMTDNYHFMNYMLIRETIDNLISWRLIWGFPPNLEKLLASETSD
ncbi:MAG: hypothetical protein A2W19_15605 [Spirochaetes bacterium RBG_16_49_21]|nr:MAG: hypothetical protein A2W19_15605 [Spirochaetes bacterium RBG_16_49_21]